MQLENERIEDNLNFNLKICSENEIMLKTVVIHLLENSC